MIQHENRCVDCGLPCMGDSCPNHRVRVKYCDECGCETDILYEYDGRELCKDCFIDVVLEEAEVIE